MFIFSRVRPNMAAASVVALSLGALVAATPAQAQDKADGASTTPATVNLAEGAYGVVEENAQPNAISDCPANRLCLFSGLGFSGTVWHFGDDSRDNLWIGLSSALNDKADSLFNNRNAWASVDKDNPKSGNWLCLRPHQQEADLRQVVFQGDGSMVFKNISSYNLTLSGACIPP